MLCIANKIYGTPHKLPFMISIWHVGYIFMEN